MPITEPLRRSGQRGRACREARDARRRWLRLLVPLLLAAPACLCSADSAADPSVDELAAIALINRHRAERTAGNNRLSDAVAHRELDGQGWNSARADSAKLPPLIPSPILELAARTILAAGPKPESKKPYDATQALHAAGYPPDGQSLVILAENATSLYLAYAAAYVRIVGEVQTARGVMPVFAGDRAMQAGWREVGAAVSCKNGRWSLVLALGGGSAKRHLGGCAFLDANHNGRYDAGEGRAGIRVRSGDATMTTGPSGCWWLALPTDGAVDVVFAGNGFSMTRQVPKGDANLVIDWRLPNPADIKAADKLIADAEKVAKETDLDKSRSPLAALLTGTRTAALDTSHEERIAALTEPIREDFISTIKRAQSLLGEEPADYRKHAAALALPWKGALKSWFRELDAVYALRRQANTVLAAAPEQRLHLAAPLLLQLNRALVDSGDPVFIEAIESLHAELESIPPAGASEGPAPRKRGSAGR